MQTLARTIEHTLSARPAGKQKGGGGGREGRGRSKRATDKGLKKSWKGVGEIVRRLQAALQRISYVISGILRRECRPVHERLMQPWGGEFKQRRRAAGGPLGKSETGTYQSLFAYR